MAISTEGLRTFAAVAEHMNFTRAGEAVHRTQSAVSMQIKRLEEELGRKLFERRSGRVALTREGETLLSYARRMLRLHDQAVAAVADPGLEGVVRFGAPEIYGPRFFPDILARFAQVCPGVQVNVRCEPSRVLEASVDRGTLDLAILSLPEPDPEYEELHLEPVVWAASQDMDLTGDQEVPLAVFDEGCFFRARAMASLKKSGRETRVAYVSPSLAGILAAVQAGLAVAPVAAASVQSGMRLLGPEDGFLPLAPSVVALKRSPRGMSPAGEKLAQIVAREFRRGVPAVGAG